MKKINIKLLILPLVLAITLSAGCITLAPPDVPSPAPTTTPTAPATPINPTWTPPPLAETTTTTLPSIADVVAQVKPSVVAINTEIVSYDIFNRPFTQEGAGSGWIIDANGIIVTNNHVVQDAQNITVTLDDGSTYNVDAQTVFTDTLNDLAILKISASNLPALKIGKSSKLRIGDWVVAIGNALGQGLRATEGIVSRQEVSLQVDVGQTLYDLIETTAAINPGNSGGPLVNLAGEVVGITSAKIATIGVEGMGYAIATDTAVPILEALIQNGYVVRPWLGVSLYTVDPFTVLRYNLPVKSGVLVRQVVPRSPAEQAGLQSGDVIVSVDGKDVTDAEQLIRMIHSSKIGVEMNVSYWRGNTQKTALVTPRESPPP